MKRNCASSIHNEVPTVLDAGIWAARMGTASVLRGLRFGQTEGGEAPEPNTHLSRDLQRSRHHGTLWTEGSREAGGVGRLRDQIVLSRHPPSTTLGLATVQWTQPLRVAFSF